MEDVLFIAMAVLLIVTYGWALMQRSNVIQLIEKYETLSKELTEAEKLIVTYELFTDIDKNQVVRETYDKISAEMKDDSY